MSSKKQLPNISIFQDTSINPLLQEQFDGVRRALHNGRVFFCIVDVIEVLIETSQSPRYWNELREKESKVSKTKDVFGFTEKVKITGRDNKDYRMDCADLEGILRIIQSISSSKTEPFKLWMAKVAVERIEEEKNPDLTIDRGIDRYREMGFDEKTIDIRIRGKVKRNFITFSWKKGGATDKEIGMLTNIVMKESTGLKASEYYQYKELTQGKDNLRDHMDHMELLLLDIAESMTYELNKSKNSSGIEELAKNAEDGGKTAGRFRKDMEKTLGRSIVNKSNRLDYMKLNKKRSKKIKSN